MNKTLLTVLVVLLSACSGGGVEEVDISIVDDLTLETSASSNTTSDDGVNLESFNMDPNTVNPAIDGGAFEISWEASNFSSGYYARLLFSLDTSPSDGDAVVFAEFCSTDDCGQTEVTTTCFFTSSNVMSCLGFGGVNLSSFIPALPVDAFLILQLCDDPEFTSCSNEFEAALLL